MRIISRDFGIAEDENYNKFFFRKKDGEDIQVYHLYKVQRFDDSVCFVLAPNEEDAKCQAACDHISSFDDKYDETIKRYHVERVDFRVRGWGSQEF